MSTYQTKKTHPGTLPSATIYLGGLLCFCFDNTEKCTVAVNNLVGNQHTWKFSIKELDQKAGKLTPILACKQGDPGNWSEIHITVKSHNRRGVHVYNGGPVSIPHIKEQRFNLESHWVDLEGPRGHNRKIENDKNTLWPRFYINDALFCASKLSTATFDLKNSKPTPLTKPLGQITLSVVADIFLDTSSHIEVQLASGKILPLDNTKRYEIYIANDCNYALVAPDESDFHLHYNAFAGAFNGDRGKLKPEDRFHLVCNASAKGKGESNLAYDPLTDRAPCMATVLGQTKTFNT